LTALFLGVSSEEESEGDEDDEDEAKRRLRFRLRRRDAVGFARGISCGDGARRRRQWQRASSGPRAYRHTTAFGTVDMLQWPPTFGQAHTSRCNVPFYLGSWINTLRSKRWIVDRATLKQARAEDLQYVDSPDHIDLLNIYFANRASSHLQLTPRTNAYPL